MDLVLFQILTMFEFIVTPGKQSLNRMSARVFILLDEQVLKNAFQQSHKFVQRAKKINYDRALCI